MSTDTAFAFAMRGIILEYIAKCRREGTTGLGYECLRQTCPTPPTTLPGAPVGTNARWAYDQLFREVCEDPRIKPFILPELHGRRPHEVRGSAASNACLGSL